MPDTILFIPSPLVLIGFAMLIGWACFWGSHNRILARISLAGFIVSVVVAYYVHTHGGDYEQFPTLTTLGMSGFMAFSLAGFAWSLLDTIPTFKSLFRRH